MPQRRLLASMLALGIGTSPDAFGMQCSLQEIVDGDSIKAKCDGETKSLHIDCVVTPKEGQDPFYKEAKKGLERLLPRKFSVTIEREQSDDHVDLATIYLPGKEDETDKKVNRLLIEKGLGVVHPYCRYIQPDRVVSSYCDAQSQAKKRGQGVWRTDGSHQTPWEQSEGGAIFADSNPCQ